MTLEGATNTHARARPAAVRIEFLVAVPVLLSAWFLRREIIPSPSMGTDMGVHTAFVRWAQRRFEAGAFPVDGWFAYLSGGLPAFHEYQTFPHLVTGAIAAATGVDNALEVTRWVLLATLPISYYVGARLLFRSRSTAVACAWIAPLMSSPTMFGAEWTGFMTFGLGLWSMLWCVWLAPVAIGLSTRAMTDRRFTLPAGIATGLCVVSHLTLGHLVVAMAAVAALVTSGPTRSERARALGLVACGTVATSAWLFVPFLTDTPWANRSRSLQNTRFYDGYGMSSLGRWLVHGELFDFGRPALLTGAALVGLALCVRAARANSGARVVLALAGLSVFLTAGRATWGPVFRILPGSSDLLAHRYIAGIHIAAVLLGGVAIDSATRWVHHRTAGLDDRHLAGRADRSGTRARVVLTGRSAHALGLVVALGLSAVAWSAPARFANLSGDLVDVNRGPRKSEFDDFARLVRRAKADRGQRVFAGRLHAPSKSDDATGVGTAAGPYLVTAEDADSVGYSGRTLSLLTDIEGEFDPKDPTDYELWNVSHIITQAGHTALVPATRVATSGDITLWRLTAPGYVSVVDTVGPAISADRSTMRDAMLRFLRSDGVRAARYPVVRFNGGAAARPTLAAHESTATRPGRVARQDHNLDQGRFRADVDLRRSGAALFRVAFHPRLHATIDGRPAPAYMVAPGMVAVTVPRGHHRVELHYQPYPGYPVIGLASAVLLCLVAWRSRRGSRRSDPDERCSLGDV